MTLVWRARGAAARALRSGVRMESTWHPAVSSGKVPVYDAALAYIEEDAAALREKLAQAKQSGAAPAEHLDALEIVSEINLPHVRAQFRAGNCTSVMPYAHTQTTSHGPYSAISANRPGAWAARWIAWYVNIVYHADAD